MLLLTIFLMCTVAAVVLATAQLVLMPPPNLTPWVVLQIFLIYELIFAGGNVLFWAWMFWAFPM